MKNFSAVFCSFTTPFSFGDTYTSLSLIPIPSKCHQFRSAIRLLVIHNIDPDNICGYRKDYLIRHPALNLIELYAKSRKLIKGINFIRSLHPHENLWLYFGETLEREEALSLAIAVYKEALNDHPKSMAIHKRLAIVCERTDNLQGAIDISQSALDKGVLEDGTKGGFKGRLLRLENKRKKQRK